MATAAKLMTVEEYRAHPENGRLYELWNGERVEVTRPRLKHVRIQHSLRDLMLALAEGDAFVGVELPFRALPEHELRAADVAYVAADLWIRCRDMEDFPGVPDIVVEVLSPSNSAGEILEKRNLCLGNGGREFWVVDATRSTVTVSSNAALPQMYQAGERVPFLAGFIEVDEIFA